MIEQDEIVAGDILPDEVIVVVDEVSADTADVAADVEIVADWIVATDEVAVEKADVEPVDPPEIVTCNGFVEETVLVVGPENGDETGLVTMVGVDEPVVTDDVKRTDDDATVDLWLGDDALQIVCDGGDTSPVDILTFNDEVICVLYAVDPVEMTEMPMVYHTMLSDQPAGEVAQEEPGAPNPFSAGPVAAQDLLPVMAGAYPLY